MSSETNDNELRVKIDSVFSEAVRRKIVLRDIDNLETTGEIDLSGMAFPVARAACRFVLNMILANSSQPTKRVGKNLVFVTGAGASHTDSSSSSLRDYVQEILASDFSPPVESIVQAQEQSKVLIKAKELTSWIKKQR